MESESLRRLKTFMDLLFEEMLTKTTDLSFLSSETDRILVFMLSFNISIFAVSLS